MAALVFVRKPRLTSTTSKFVCQVYTLGTRWWRSCFEPVAATLIYETYPGTFLNGILHWLVVDLKGCHWISCFDLETEIFSTFSPPPNLRGGEPDFGQLYLVVSGDDYLYLYDNRPKSNENDEIVIWLMEYGVDKSWTKAFVINRITDLPNAFDGYVYLIKVYDHGFVMVTIEGVFYYSNKTKAAANVVTFGELINIAVLCRPNFLSLGSTFPMENTKSF